ncbi:hypothetical protein BC936DRAFT_149863 [Jimgerdemannia flammicorona]|uniref:Uncharacterized protein n=1 Tax=Jimgerdemannia flammicorona TaxID=994334 RepID=A0A433CZZ6_9FUNG|nr:hypothetical protein BC936DRAFT_149863 [Jimgerdemannia flammicorona]
MIPTVLPFVRDVKISACALGQTLARVPPVLADRIAASQSANHPCSTMPVVPREMPAIHNANATTDSSVSIATSARTITHAAPGPPPTSVSTAMRNWSATPCPLSITGTLCSVPSPVR